jgi:hypothetical protein
MSLKVAELLAVCNGPSSNFAENSLVLTGAPEFRKFPGKGSLEDHITCILSIFQRFWI